jgi:hypothetical protein
LAAYVGVQGHGRVTGGSDYSRDRSYLSRLPNDPTATARVQFLDITGPIYLPAELLEHADAFSRKFGCVIVEQPDALVARPKA